MAKNLHSMCIEHLSQRKRKIEYDLYRIFFYDCPPLEKRVQLPVSKKNFDFSKSETFIFRKQLHQELVQQRKIALRLGWLTDRKNWLLKPNKTKELIQGKIDFRNVTDNDFSYNTQQKGVDMKIGLDIASLAYKKLVDQIILLSGDSDFVPAAKLARREGIDFILDPMGASVHPDLLEHIDGIRTTAQQVLRRNTKKLSASELVK